MAECLLKLEAAPTSPDVVQRERMPERMEAALRRIESMFPAQFFDIPEHVAATEFRPISGDEDHRVSARPSAIEPVRLLKVGERRFSL